MKYNILYSSTEEDELSKIRIQEVDASNSLLDYAKSKRAERYGYEKE